MTTHAQMVPGSRVIGECKELGLDRDHRTRDFTIQEIACSTPSNVLWPKDKVSLKFRVTNLSASALTADGTLQVVRYGTRGKPGDIWEPLFYQTASVDSVPIHVDLAPHAATEVLIEPRIPETFGGYLLFAEFQGHGRCFAASLVRSMQPDGGSEQYPAYALDLEGTSVPVAQFFKRLGIKGARLGVDPFGLNDKDFDKKWADLTQRCRTLQDNEITTMFTSGAGSYPMPLGRPRPHLENDGTFRETKSDLSWLPSADGEFQGWVKKVCGTFGWPKGPINAFELWNEPWEGISISGWGADMIRYREIYTAMARGIETARAMEKTQVLIGGCGSSSNTRDKLFPDGSDTFLKWLDFCSIHYQVMSATPALMRDFVNREQPSGPVRVWDTESWIANTEDRVGLVIASMHAMGQERAMGVYAGNVYDPQPATLSDGTRGTIVQAWSAAAAVGASTKFVGQRRFRGLLFQNGLPWVFVFDGRPGQSDDDGTVVVAGDLGGCYARGLLPFRTVLGLKNRERIQGLQKQIAALPPQVPDTQRRALEADLETASLLEGASFTITDGGGRFVLSDFYGNRIPSGDGKITIPLNGNGYYLRTNGTAGSFTSLLREIRNGRIDGYEPVEIVPHDLTEQLNSVGSALRLTITNVLNRPVAGKLLTRFDGVEAEVQEIRLEAGETREIAAKLNGGIARQDNRYPLHVEFDAGRDGKAVHDEDMHANVISRRTIAVDGNLDDWQGVVPQTLAAAGIGANLTEKAWLPFTDFHESDPQGLATGYLAYDADNFYFAARIPDRTPDAGMVRFETRDDNQYFYPETSLRIDENATFAKMDRTVENRDFHRQSLARPEGGDRSHTVWDSVATTLGFRLDLPAGSPHQVAFYFLSWDPLGRHSVNFEITDAATGKVLDRQTLKDFGDGKYVVYDLAGSVRITIASTNWLKGVLSGIFFDPTKTSEPAPGASARFIRIDDQTLGDWQGKYGVDGCEIAGSPSKLPSYAQVTFQSELIKQPLRWPDGVRRFSYRQRPDLPAGGPESHDNVQIAFNVLPDDQKPWLSSPPGTPRHWMMYWDTDYEYALNEVAPQYGGGTEVWRLQVPGMPRKHFYPRQPASSFDGPVKNARLVMRRESDTRIVEAALPWSEIPDVKRRLDAGQTIKFDFRVNDNGGPSRELATGRSISKQNSITFHNDWQTHWSNELEFGFEK